LKPYKEGRKEGRRKEILNPEPASMAEEDEIEDCPKSNTQTGVNPEAFEYATEA
jgi:hypothetical protein